MDRRGFFGMLLAAPVAAAVAMKAPKKKTAAFEWQDVEWPDGVGGPMMATDFNFRHVNIQLSTWDNGRHWYGTHSG